MRSKLSFFLVIVSLFMLLSACGTTQGHYQPTQPVEGVPPEPIAASTPEVTEPAMEDSEAPESASPEPVATPDPVPTTPLYQFGIPLEEQEPVEDDSCFENAVFLGDSRTEGLQLFGGLKCGTFYWARGMSVFAADDEEGHKVFDVDGEKFTLVGTLSKHAYDAVYIMIGVNELGYPAESYEQGLGELVDKVLTAQPEAVVYLQLMPPVNDAMCRANKLGDYINNDKLNQFNAAITRVAERKQVVLLNTAEAYTGEDGQLPEELASDGCHFSYGAYTLWADYLRGHVMDREQYLQSRQQAE